MNAVYTTNVPRFYWIMTTFLTVWNIIGLMALGNDTLLYFGQANDDYANQLQSMPFWYMILYALAVLSAFASCVLLWFKRKEALPVAILSFIVMLGSTTYAGSLKGFGSMEAFEITLTLAVVIMGALLIWFCQYAKTHWLELR